MHVSRIIGWRRLAAMGLLLLLAALVLAACQGEAGDETTATPAGQDATLAPAELTATMPSPTEAPTQAPQATEPADSEAPAETEAAPAVAPVTEEATDEPPPATATAAPAVTESQVTSISLVPVAGGFARPVYLTHAFDERLFVVEQAGRIHIISGGARLDQPFLDISQRVGSSALEQGLLSVAFHPDYRQNGRFFVYYTDLQGDVVLAEYRVDAADPDRADPASERIFLTVDQPFGNHNGGQLHFGPDSYLYMGLGDGGGAGDTLNQGQDPSTLLGALLRLDVDGGDPYGIPADNPFVGVDGFRDEIWAYGLRNPWRFSFDRQLGDLYVSDVGQNMWEEVNVEPAGSPGGANYGWNVMESNHCFGADSCDAAAFVAPVAEYRHQEGNCSITGGYVYRGASYPSLSGNYFLADYCSGALWSLFGDAASGWQLQPLQRTGMFVSSFGEDWSGELYLLDHVNGDIYQLQP